jgi:hypothetical protein
MMISYLLDRTSIIENSERNRQRADLGVNIVVGADNPTIDNGIFIPLAQWTVQSLAECVKGWATLIDHWIPVLRLPRA